MAEDDTPDRKDGTERRVYNLPAPLLQRLRAYQVSQAIPSEVEAARRLLDYALQMRDTVFNILQTLEARFNDERDLRVLAGDVLTKHTLVTQVHFEDDSASFTLKNDEQGRIMENGDLYYRKASDDHDYWRAYQRVKGKLPSQSPAAKASSEAFDDALNDDLPF